MKHTHTRALMSTTPSLPHPLRVIPVFHLENQIHLVLVKTRRSPAWTAFDDSGSPSSVCDQLMASSSSPRKIFRYLDYRNQTQYAIILILVDVNHPLLRPGCYCCGSDSKSESVGYQRLPYATTQADREIRHVPFSEFMMMLLRGLQTNHLIHSYLPEFFGGEPYFDAIIGLGFLGRLRYHLIHLFSDQTACDEFNQVIDNPLFNTHLRNPQMDRIGR